MSKIICDIIEVIHSMNGAFLPHSRTAPEGLEDLYNEVYLNPERRSINDDKHNIGQDVTNLRKDFKVAVRKYKEMA